MFAYLDFPKIEHPKPPMSLFLQVPTEENLIEDIKYFFYNLNPNVPNLSYQKWRVLELDNTIKKMLELFKHEMLDYKIVAELEKVQYFITISNRTIDEFDLKLQILVGGVYKEFQLRE